MKQTKLGFANPYQSGEGYEVNELVYYNGGLRMVQTAIAQGSVATGAEFTSPVSPEWDYSTFRVVSGTKKVSIDPSAVADGTTRTLSMPDANVNLGAVITALAHDAATHALTMTTPAGSSTLTIPGVNVIEVASGISVVAKKGCMYVMTSNGTGSTVSFDLGATGNTELLGSTVMWLSACQATMTLTAPEFQWENNGGTASFSTITFMLYPGEMLVATRKSNTVYLNKISRVVDPAIFKLKNATGGGSYSFASNATAARIITLPDGDPDLRYLPRSNFDTGNSLSNGGATISGTAITLTGRVVVAAGSSVTGGGNHCFLGTNHPSSPVNAASALNGSYCGFLVGNNLNLFDNGFGTYALRCAGGVALRSTIKGTDNWYGNVDNAFFDNASNMYFGLVRYCGTAVQLRHQVWDGVHGISATNETIPTSGAHLTSSLLRNATTDGKTVFARYVLLSMNGTSTFATADGSQNATPYYLPPATLGTRGVACHEITVVTRQMSGTADSSAVTVGGRGTVMKRRVRVHYDPSQVTPLITAIETVGTDFVSDGAAGLDVSITFPVASFTQTGTWSQPLLQITPNVGTIRSAAVTVESTYIVNGWT